MFNGEGLTLRMRRYFQARCANAIISAIFMASSIST